MRDMCVPISSLWDTFQSTLEESISRNIPTKNAKLKDGYPWITRDIRKLIRKRDRWYKRMKKSGNNHDASKFKELKRKTQQEMRRAYWKYIDGIVTPEPNEECDNNRKRFWTFIKHRRSDGNSVPPLKRNGVLHPDPTDKANILNNQFQQAFSDSVNVTSEEFKQRCKMEGQYPEINDIVYLRKEF
ncbi:hypothetical protein FSP39_006608 [Pinctada imbricata]|uniref:Uncharacterized protein n=1 Tax=Pinctada imbricata TaxID=66713 RepID=A0AA89BUK0_PINIB|nr:hypothetical protein FSP39_006608 [Pinctada imbricata]